MSKKKIVSCVNELGFPFKTLDPFLFCVYHKDAYPAGNKKMEAPRRGNGADFNPNAPYRYFTLYPIMLMYKLCFLVCGNTI